MHGLRDRSSRARARQRRLFFEPLEERSLLAAIITVNSAFDTNARDELLTLREAILINNRTLAVASLSPAEQALVSGTPKSSDADTINFNIPGSGVRTIFLTTVLPEITDSAIIDGYTQPGTAQNTDPNGFNGKLLIELNAAGAGPFYGLRLRASSSTIRGLIVNSSKAYGIQINNSSNNTIAGNLIGTDPTGTVSVPNQTGISVLANSASATTNNLIGGSTPAARNVISGNTGFGITVQGVLDTNKVQGTRIQGNLIGTDVSGTLALGNSTGVNILDDTANTLIGGSAVGEGNVISGNRSSGIALGGGQNTCSGAVINGHPSSGNVIQGNRIGTDISGTQPLGNAMDGIGVGFDANSTQTIGGTDNGAGNIIAFNGLHGIGLLLSHSSVLSNSIFSNSQLGIHLGLGCTPATNDTDDADSGPNNLQNFPVLGSAIESGAALQVQYSVPSTTANSAYPLRVEFFTTDADGQEGKTFLGFDTYAAAEAGTTKTAAITLPAAVVIGSKVVATATDTNGNTSEFSASALVQTGSCSIIVTNTNNSGAGSLRQAITCANGDGFDDLISVPAGQYNLSGAASEDANVSGDLDLIEANHTITIHGAGDQTILNGGGIDRVIHVLPNVAAVLESLSITGGSATNGGGIFSTGNLTLNDAAVSNNSAAMGGGISNTGQLTLNRTSVHDNTATSTTGVVLYGGGIYSSVAGVANPAVTIVNSTIQSNGVSISTTSTSAPAARGGGIASLSVPVTITNSTIQSNTADISATTATSSTVTGAGIYISNSTLTITGSDVSQNRSSTSAGSTGSALIDGGGIYASNSSLTVDHSSIVDNTIVNTSATTGLINALGGGVYYSTSNASNTLSISDSAISRNSVQAPTVSTGGSVADGAAIRATGGIIDISRTTIDANSLTAAASALGAGLDVGGSGTTATTLTMTAVVVSANTINSPTPQGGGIFAGLNTTATISQSTIRDNQLTSSGTGSGAGVYFSGNQLTLDASTVSGNAINSSTSGTGAGIRITTALTLINSTVSGNSITGAATATSSGGGISRQNGAGAILIRNSTITGNRVVHGLSGGFDNAAATVTIYNSIVAGNFAGSAGATPSDIVNPISSNSRNNLIGDAATGGGLTNGVNGNQVGNNGSGTIDINTVLNTTLADNGGLTLTHTLVLDSPAINAGDINQALDANGQPLTTDQRGAGHARLLDKGPDIGAFELAPPLCSSVVTNTNDSGLGSLRQAIICANATANVDRTGDGVADPDVISFAISGPGVETISPASTLPTITDPVIIDGYTQPGASANTLSAGDNATLLIEINGGNQPTTGLTIAANDSVIRGLVINRFLGTAIAISSVGSQTASNNVVEGNFIGTNAAGAAALSNGYGIRLGAVNSGAQMGLADNNRIGGSSPAARNVISGQSGTNQGGLVLDGGYGISLDTAFSSSTVSNTVIQGNFIGTDATGTKALANTVFGIFSPPQDPASGSITGLVIGGAAPGEGNLISGNTFAGIYLSDGAIQRDARIQGNKIGTDITGTLPLGNNGPGIATSFGGQIGGVNPGEGNTIAFNSYGVAVVDGTTAINRNSIFQNAALGIDLGTDSTTANDPGDADSGPNNLQNFPELTAVAVVGTEFSAKYSVPSDPANSQYPLRIEFFKADASDQGQTFLGSDTYTADEANTPASVFFTSLISLAPGDKIVATATDAAGNTSEFSSAIATQSCLTVVNTDDSGPGSLRQAMLCANASQGSDTISFNISGDGVQTISPLSALPAITDATIIDGYTQSGASANTNAIDDPDPLKRGLNGTLLIQLSGPPAGTPAMAGLNITGDGSTVRGLVINGFANSGIRISGGSNNVIVGNYIGTDSTGESAAGNGKWGILLDTASAGNRIGTDGDGLADAAEENLIGASGFGGIGILGTGTDNNIVAGNLIGIDAIGTGAIGNANRGVDIYGGAQKNRVGTAADGVHDSAERNIISQNAWAGVGIYNAGTSFNVVAGNWIGVDITGSAPRPNAKGGVNVFGGATSNTIGGLAPGAGNVIAFNALYGINVVESATTENSLLGNSIFGNSGLGIDLGSTGFTANDSLPTADADIGPNNLQNFPVISYATRDSGQLKVTYNVPSDPTNSTYPLRVEFFLADATSQGKTYLGFDTFTEDDFTAGGKTAEFATASPAKVFDKIVATATDSLTADLGGGPANTSEFSAQATIVSPWQNPGPLRWDVVGNDGRVVAEDVLAVINYINSGHGSLVPDNAKNEQPYFDVDGDNHVVAADVVDVINYINAGKSMGGEAESPWAGQASAATNNDILTLIAADIAAESSRKRK